MERLGDNNRNVIDGTQIYSDQRRFCNEKNLPGLQNALSVNVGLQIKRICAFFSDFFRVLLIEETLLVASVVIFIKEEDCRWLLNKDTLDFLLMKNWTCPGELRLLLDGFQIIVAFFQEHPLHYYIRLHIKLNVHVHLNSAKLNKCGLTNNGSECGTGNLSPSF